MEEGKLVDDSVVPAITGLIIATDTYKESECIRDNKSKRHIARSLVKETTSKSKSYI